MSTNKRCTKHPKFKVNIGFLLRKKDRSPSEQEEVRKYATDQLVCFKTSLASQIELRNKWGTESCRLQGLSQELSEVMIMLVYNLILKDRTCRKREKCGDLISEHDGVIECKSKNSTNKAPGSCGGTQRWDTLVLLKKLKEEDKYCVWRLKIKSEDEKWNVFKIANKDKTKKLVRPRLEWDTIEEHFKAEIETIFEGTFEDILKDDAATPIPEPKATEVAM